MSDFKKWFIDQYFYKNMRFIYGDALFDKDADFYRVLAVQIAYEAWSAQRQHSKDEIEQLNIDLGQKNKRIHDLEFYTRQFLGVLSEDPSSPMHKQLPLLKCHLLQIVNRDFQLSKALRGENEEL